MGSRVRRFKSHLSLCHSPVTSLCPSFLIYKMGILTPIPKGCWVDEMSSGGGKASCTWLQSLVTAIMSLTRSTTADCDEAHLLDGPVPGVASRALSLMWALDASARGRACQSSLGSTLEAKKLLRKDAFSTWPQSRRAPWRRDRCLGSSPRGRVVSGGPPPPPHRVPPKQQCQQLAAGIQLPLRQSPFPRGLHTPVLGFHSQDLRLAVCPASGKEQTFTESETFRSSSHSHSRQPVGGCPRLSVQPLCDPEQTSHPTAQFPHRCTRCQYPHS